MVYCLKKGVLIPVTNLHLQNSQQLTGKLCEYCRQEKHLMTQDTQEKIKTCRYYALPFALLGS